MKLRHLQWKIARLAWAVETALAPRVWRPSWVPQSFLWPEGYSREHPQWEWSERIEQRVRAYREWWARRPR